MRRLSSAALLSLLLLGMTPSAWADATRVEQAPEESPPPGELAREGVERLLRALNAFIEMLPQYEMPQINENGDIIIRRKRNDDPPPAPPDEGQTST